MTDTCPDVLLRHCHGTWIVHVDHAAECTLEGCSTPADGHELVVVCTDLVPGCGCAPREGGVEGG